MNKIALPKAPPSIIHLCIGGCMDGRSVETPLTKFSVNRPDAAIMSEAKHMIDSYHRLQLCGKRENFYFMVCDDLSDDQAIDSLMSAYQALRGMQKIVVPVTQ